MGVGSPEDRVGVTLSAEGTHGTIRQVKVDTMPASLTRNSRAVIVSEQLATSLGGHDYYLQHLLLHHKAGG